MLPGHSRLALFLSRRLRLTSASGLGGHAADCSARVWPGRGVLGGDGRGGRSGAKASPRDPRHGQARLVQSHPPGPRAHRLPPPRRHAREQPGGEPALGHLTTRAKAARVQIPGLSPEVPLQSRRHLQHLQSEASPDLPTRPSPASRLRSPGAGGRRRGGLKTVRGMVVAAAADLTCQFRHGFIASGAGRDARLGASNTAR